MTRAFIPPELLRELTERYAAEGYTPVSTDRVPATLAGDGGADLVFERGDQLVLVQLKRATTFVPSPDATQLTKLASDVRKFANVRLDVVNIPEPMDALPDRGVIVDRANAAAAMVSNSAEPRVVEAALLLAASATEGALVRLLRDREILAGAHPGLGDLAATAWSEGLMTENQWERLQRATDRRNAVAHGLTPGVVAEKADVDTLVELARVFANPDFQTALDLAAWFFEHYENPAEHVPFDSGEGGYQYVNGGPFDADGVLADEFPDTPDETRQLAVEQIEGYGYEWVRSGDY